MKDFIESVGAIVVLPIIAVEAVIKLIMTVLFYLIMPIIAIIYPLIKTTRVLDFMDKWIKYSSRWKKGFYSCILHKYWC